MAVAFLHLPHHQARDWLRRLSPTRRKLLGNLATPRLLEFDRLMAVAGLSARGNRAGASSPRGVLTGFPLPRAPLTQLAHTSEVQGKCRNHAQAYKGNGCERLASPHTHASQVRAVVERGSTDSTMVESSSSLLSTGGRVNQHIQRSKTRWHVAVFAAGLSLAVVTMVALPSDKHLQFYQNLVVGAAHAEALVDYPAAGGPSLHHGHSNKNEAISDRSQQLTPAKDFMGVNHHMLVDDRVQLRPHKRQARSSSPNDRSSSTLEGKGAGEKHRFLLSGKQHKREAKSRDGGKDFHERLTAQAIMAAGLESIYEAGMSTRTLPTDPQCLHEQAEEARSDGLHVADGCNLVLLLTVFARASVN
eukprot:scaffold1210_cov410-Prasinococcus_capsulatus_cf.AAC.4